jgi:hypothetical protein
LRHPINPPEFQTETLPMAAGVSDTLHDMAWIAGIIDAAAPAPKARGPYKKKGV